MEFSFDRRSACQKLFHSTFIHIPKGDENNFFLSHILSRKKNEDDENPAVIYALTRASKRE
jgi:hypothetical protein